MIIHIHSMLRLIRMAINVLAAHFKHCNTHNMTEGGHVSISCQIAALNSILLCIPIYSSMLKPNIF